MAKINVSGGEMGQKEIDAYIDFLEKEHPERIFHEIAFKIDGDFVDVQYSYSVRKFERIRRITGYLVGDLGRWNDGKRAEERDRLKHMEVSSWDTKKR